MSSNSVCNHTREKQIGLPLLGRPILFITRMITDRIGLHSVLLPLLNVVLQCHKKLEKSLKLEISEWFVLGARMGKSGSLERAQLANHILQTTEMLEEKKVMVIGLSGVQFGL